MEISSNLGIGSSHIYRTNLPKAKEMQAILSTMQKDSFVASREYLKAKAEEAKKAGHAQKVRKLFDYELVPLDEEYHPGLVGKPCKIAVRNSSILPFLPPGSDPNGYTWGETTYDASLTGIKGVFRVSFDMTIPTGLQCSREELFGKI